MILEGGAILMKLNQLDTEKVNQNSLHIDEMSTIDILKTINNEDQKVAFVVQDVILLLEGLKLLLKQLKVQRIRSN